MLGARARNRQLLSKATIAAIRTLRERRLRLDSIHARLQRRQISPAASIQRKFADRGRIHHCVNVGSCQLHRGCFARDFNFLGSGADLHREIERQRRTNSQRDSASQFGLESWRSEFQFVRSRQQVRRDIKAVFVSRGAAGHAGGHVRDSDIGIRKHTTAAVYNRTGNCSAGNLSLEFAPG